nr:MAG TPA: hypothetical protein [Caudoviricetes sp.]
MYFFVLRLLQFTRVYELPASGNTTFTGFFSVAIHAKRKQINIK